MLLIMETEPICKKCNDTGKVTDKDGTIHTCFDCLISGRLDNHSKKLPDHPEIKL
jgi:hypothetical protein